MDEAPCKMIHVLSYRQWLRTTLILLVKYSSILTLPITCHVMFCFSSIKRLLSGGDASSPCPRPLREGILKISSNISHSCGWQSTVLWHLKLGTQRPTSYSERTLCHTNHGIQKPHLQQCSVLWLWPCSIDSIWNSPDVTLQACLPCLNTPTTWTPEIRTPNGPGFVFPWWQKCKPYKTHNQWQHCPWHEITVTMLLSSSQNVITGRFLENGMRFVLYNLQKAQQSHFHPGLNSILFEIKSRLGTWLLLAIWINISCFINLVLSVSTYIV